VGDHLVNVTDVTTLDDLLANAVLMGNVPYVVAAVGTSARTAWIGAAGDRGANEPAAVNTVFRIMSMSKGIASTAAAILADRGSLDWDAPVDTVLPEFAELQVLDGFDDAAHPILRDPRSRATIRQLATHTSGLAYELYDSSITNYMRLTSTPPAVSGRHAALRCPLAVDPGLRWQYGTGADWLGLVVAEIDGRSIDQLCNDEIFAPLLMIDTEFELRADQRPRLGSIHDRTVDGSLVPAAIQLGPPSQPEFYGMGHALYSTVPDYLRFLRMWLGYGQVDGIRILKHETATDFLCNHIGTLRLQAYPSMLPALTEDLDFLEGTETSHSLGFARTEEAWPGGRSAGSQSWAGILNTHFWFDPHQDVAAVMMTQLLPFMDRRALNTMDSFERAVYSTLRHTHDRLA
jgi:methyl acetate hydrolase